MFACVCALYVDFLRGVWTQKRKNGWEVVPVTTAKVTRLFVRANSYRLPQESACVSSSGTRPKVTVGMQTALLAFMIRFFYFAREDTALLTWSLDTGTMVTVFQERAQTTCYLHWSVPRRPACTAMHSTRYCTVQLLSIYDST